MADSGEASGASVGPHRRGPDSAEAAYHLRLEPLEASAVSGALRLLIADEAHESQIRSHARAVLEGLAADAGDDGLLELPLTAPQMKIAHTAIKLLHDDLGREEAEQRRVLAQILGKLPDEHAIRAIVLD